MMSYVLCGYRSTGQYNKIHMTSYMDLTDKNYYWRIDCFTFFNKNAVKRSI